MNENDALVLTARLVAAYGDARVADNALRALWLRELLEAFEGYAPERLNKAMGAVIRKSKFWPTIAEIMEALREDTPPPSRPVFSEKPEPPLTPEEVRRRGIVIANLKAQYGYGRSDAQSAEATKAEPEFYGYDTEVSDVSPALKAVLKKQGHRDDV